MVVVVKAGSSPLGSTAPVGWTALVAGETPRTIVVLVVVDGVGSVVLDPSGVVVSADSSTSVVDGASRIEIV